MRFRHKKGAMKLPSTRREARTEAISRPQTIEGRRVGGKIRNGLTELLQLPADARRAPDVGVGRQLVQHEVRHVGAGNTHRRKKAADVPAVPVAAPFLAV